MMKAKPVSLRRKSFGGQTGIGIWWRKRSAESSVAVEQDEGPNNKNRNDEVSNPSSPSGSTSEESGCHTEEQRPKKRAETTEEEPVLGWDDDLCRPIYHHHRDTTDSFGSDLARLVSSGDSGIEEAAETDTSIDVIDEDLSGRADAASHEEKSNPPSPAVVANEEFKSRQTSVRDEDKGVETFRIPVLSRKRTRTFGNRGNHRRPLSLILTQEDQEATSSTCDRETRRVSLESTEEDKAPEILADEREHQERNSKDVPETRTDSESDAKSCKRRRSRKMQSDLENTLEKAREYFANLDQTQPLTLDASLSPPVSSRVTRTHRRTNLTSPGIKREYLAYAKSITGDGESGILPLSIRDYASSRKLHYENKGEIVDGFLDD